MSNRTKYMDTRCCFKELKRSETKEDAPSITSLVGWKMLVTDTLAMRATTWDSRKSHSLVLSLLLIVELPGNSSSGRHITSDRRSFLPLVDLLLLLPFPASESPDDSNDDKDDGMSCSIGVVGVGVVGGCFFPPVVAVVGGLARDDGSSPGLFHTRCSRWKSVMLAAASSESGNSV